MRYLFFFIPWLVVSGCLDKAGFSHVAQKALGDPPGAVEGIRVSRDSLRADSIDRVIFSQKLQLAKGFKTLRAKTLGVMRSFTGTPYGFGLLDGHSQEHLVVNLRELDCWTSIECSLAIALSSRDSTPDYQNFRDRLRQLRYWDGIIDGYGSRIHYFTGWVLQNEKQGGFRDITAELGGVPYQKRVSYITDIPWYYPQLEDPDVYKRLVAVQERINVRAWHYIPKDKVAGVEPLLLDGDILLLTSTRPNLDVEHHGFAVRQKGHVYLLHASSSGGKVRISSKPVHEYLAVNAFMSGIMVVRLE